MNTEFPDIPDQSTTPRFETADCITCFECGDEAFEVERPGGISSIYCRSCYPSALQQFADYGEGWEEVRNWVLERDGHNCLNCGSCENLHIHHIERFVSFERTGEAHRPDNLICLCEECHRELEGEKRRCKNLLDHIVEV